MTDRNGSMRFNSMVLLSFLLHALFLSIFLLSPSLPEKKWTFGPVYSVDLVSVSADMSESRTTEMSKELAYQIKETPAVIKKIDELQTTPLIKDSTAPSRTDNLDKVEKAIEEMKKRMAAAPRAVSPPSGAKTPSAHAARGNAGEANGGKMNAYYARLWAKIKGQWALPRGILPEQKLETVINIVILRDGTLSGLNFERSSGNKYFDQSAARAVRKASPFPPLPEWVREPRMEIGLRFLSTEFR